VVKRKLNVKKLGVFIGVILVILLVVIFGIKSLIDENNLRKTTDYKLSEIGYTANEISLIKELKKEEIDTILKHKYNVNITKLMKEKYFIFKNLDKYLDYITESSESNLTTVVAKVNTNASMGWYKTIIDTDTSKKTSMLVNKFYKLSEDYIPDDLIDVSATYGYQGKQVSSVIYDELTNLIDAAKEKGYSLIVTQGYRSYKDQLEAYDEIESSSGQDYADEVAARAGHSEYQTGLSVVVKPLYTEGQNMESSPEHTWLIENAYKYGFILRYPKDKEGITGFSYDAWRLRYVGTNISRIIHNENITFDEYYAYYIK
jgi:D-alanyl-D-alanine carboxypeptidase